VPALFFASTAYRAAPAAACVTAQVGDVAAQFGLMLHAGGLVGSTGLPNVAPHSIHS